MRISFLISCAFYFLCHTPLKAQLVLNCDHDSTGLIPLIDLGTANYGVFKGGLYPGYSNTMPAAHLTKGKNISSTIVPLNNDGEVDWEDGEIQFVGMGGSLASNPFNVFIDTMKKRNWVGVNECLKVKGLFFGGKDLRDMIDTTTLFYWNELSARLASRNDTWDKIQIVWICTMSEMDIPDSALYVKRVVDQYITLLHRMNDSMPNLKQVYMTGFHYAGYTHPDHELYDFVAEPRAYWSNLAIKMLIERQIAGDPKLAFEGPGKVAPYICWGPYWWADGTNPRTSDGLTWYCDEYRDDETGGGFHLDDGGKWKEAQMLIEFFENDPVASKWYLNAAKWSPCGTGRDGFLPDAGEQEIKIFPSPASENISIELPGDATGTLQCEIYNMNGALVLSDIINADEANLYGVRVNEFTNGIYLLVIRSENKYWSEQFIVQH